MWRGLQSLPPVPRPRVAVPSLELEYVKSFLEALLTTGTADADQTLTLAAHKVQHESCFLDVFQFTLAIIEPTVKEACVPLFQEEVMRNTSLSGVALAFQKLHSSLEPAFHACQWIDEHSGLQISAIDELFRIMSTSIEKPQLRSKSTIPLIFHLLCESFFQYLSPAASLENLASAVSYLKFFGFQTILIQAAQVALRRLIERNVKDEELPHEKTVLKGLISVVGASLDALDQNFLELDKEKRKKLEDDVLFDLHMVIIEEYSRHFNELLRQWPQSQIMADELRLALNATNRHDVLASNLIKFFTTEVLTPVSSTEHVIFMFLRGLYLAAHVDASDFTSSRLDGLLKPYIKGRNDAVHTIAAAIISGKDELLQQNLDSGYLLKELDDEDVDLERDVNDWEPRPVAGLLGKLPKVTGAKGPTWKPRRVDVLAYFVSIFGRTDTLVKELQSVVGDTFLQNPNADTDDYKHILSKLEARFGASSIVPCGVILSDVLQARGLNQSFGIEFDGMERASVTPISASFWPYIKSDDFTLPKAVQKYYDSFLEKYSEKGLKLELFKNQGTATISVEFDNGDEREYTVPPPFAAIMTLFDRRDEMTPEEAATLLGMETDLARKRLVYWVSLGVLQMSQNPTVFKPAPFPQDITSEIVDDEEALYEEEEEEDIEPFIIGLLRNSGKMTIERLHTLLKVIITDPPFIKPVSALSVTLTSMVEEGKILHDGIHYSRPLSLKQQ